MVFSCAFYSNDIDARYFHNFYFSLLRFISVCECFSMSPTETINRPIYREFEVESLNFPGQQHRWKVSELLQKGTDRTRDSLLNDLALALRFLFVTAKGRLVSHFFSVSQALKALLCGFLRILDILVGIPSLQAHNLDAKIREERCKYLVAELVCRVRIFLYKKRKLTLYIIFFYHSRKMKNLSNCYVRI